MTEQKTDDTNALGFASLAEGFQQNFERVEETMREFGKSYESMDMDPFNLASAYKEWFADLAKKPTKAD